MPGSPRPDRVQAFPNTPFGFKIHGGEFITWLEYLNDMRPPKGENFIKVARLLFEAAGEPFPEKQTPQQIAVLTQRERKQALWETFWAFLQKQLQSKKGKHALEYAESRGLSHEHIELYLGYYPTAQEVKKHLIEKGFTQEEIGYPHNEISFNKEIGSAVLYDGRWQGRLVGAWRNKSGRILNFWARDLSGKAKENEKYIMLKNASKDSPYGLDLVRGPEVVLVEGFLDAMPLWPEVPAISLGGAAITEKQIQTLAQAGVDSLTINLDYDGPDGAGHKGTLQVIESLLRHKATIQSYVIAPEAMSDPAKPADKVDPNQYVAQHGLPAYHDLTNRAQKAVCYLASTILAKHDLLTYKGKSKAIESVLSYDKYLTRETDREDMWKLVAEQTGYSLNTLLLQTKAKEKISRQSNENLKELEQTLPVSELLRMYQLPADHPLSQTDIFTAYQEITGQKDWHKVVNFLSRLAEGYVLRNQEIELVPEDYFFGEELDPQLTKKLPTLAEALKSMKEKRFLLLDAVTGGGKTYHILLEMIRRLEEGEDSTLFCSTLTEARRAIAMLKIMLKGRHNLISLNVSSNVLEGDPEEVFHQKIKVAQIAVSTYAYLGMMGHTGRLYKIAPLLIRGRNVYCDEPQELWARTKVSEALAARYLLRLGEKGRGTYNMQHRCPANAHKGGCPSCFKAYLKTALDLNNEREFYRKINEKPFSEHTLRPELPHVSWENADDPSKYQQISGNLYYQSVDIETKYDLADFNFDTKENPNKGKTYEEYFDALVTHMYNPHYRTQYPLLKEDGTERPILPEDIIMRKRIAEERGLKLKDKIQFPVATCSIPTLSGINIIPYLQLFSEAKRLAFASATMPEDMRSFLTDIGKKIDWEGEQVVIDEIPFKFRLTVLKMVDRLSLERQVKITRMIEAATGEDFQMLLVTSKKAEAMEVYGQLKNILPEKTRLFLRQDFVSMVELELTTPLYKFKGKITIIYAWSALSRGADMPDVCFVMVDCSQFIPQAGLSDINPLMTKEDIYRSLLNEIAQNLTQILGRIMRSNKLRVAGQTVIDERNIVVLLHGLPSQLMDFKVDERLIHEWKEYRDDVANKTSFVSSMEAHINDSIAESVLACLDGKEPANQFELDRERLKEKAKKKGIEMLSENQRSIVGDLQQEKAEQKKLSLEEKAKQAASEQMTWSEFYKKESLHRLAKPEQKKLKKFF